MSDNKFRRIYKTYTLIINYCMTLLKAKNNFNLKQREYII